MNRCKGFRADFFQVVCLYGFAIKSACGVADELTAVFSGVVMGGFCAGKAGYIIWYNCIDIVFIVFIDIIILIVFRYKIIDSPVSIWLYWNMGFYML